jgi:hypothetical protein
MSVAMTRRELLLRLARMGIVLGYARAGAGAFSFSSLARAATQTEREDKHPLSTKDEQLLDELERAACLFFWEQASPLTGLVMDSGSADGSGKQQIASIAATGFGLTALCIADKRRYLPGDEVRSRVRTTLEFLLDRLYSEHGFFFHFLNADTGERAWNCEVSSIDTSLLLCGVLTCGQHFTEPDIRDVARKIYERVDWPWMLNGASQLSQGWMPETGFEKYRWDAYSELMMIYLLGLGSPRHPLPAETWDAWQRPAFEYDGLKFINSYGPLFVHQYSHAWFDFRGKRDKYADYFENSILATRAHRLFCISLKDRFPDYGPDLWGITASESAHGYTVWGGPPEMGPIDGTLVPAAAAGSLPFLPQDTLTVLHTMHDRFGDQVWKRYAFVDAFNPLKNWFCPEVNGINTGISLLMAENLRSGFIWEIFMKNNAVRVAMQRAGFKPTKTVSELRSDPILSAVT